jgi:RHS repeat-associated protein
MMRRLAAAAILTLAAPGLQQRVDLVARQRAAERTSARPTQPGAGSSTTRLPDGRSLIVGGEQTEGRAWIWDGQTRALTPLPVGPQSPRAFHSATVLADGTVLLAGGRNGGTLVEIPEVFDPATRVFSAVTMTGAIPRESQSATLLVDGRLLVLGGTNGNAAPLPTQIWNLETHTAQTLPADAIGRAGHTATLASDRDVVITGGSSLAGAPGEPEVLVMDPATGRTRAIDVRVLSQAPTAMVASSPADSSENVPVDAHFGLQFSAPLSTSSLTADTLTLTGPDGIVTTRLIVAEGGRLVFVWPAAQLQEGSDYALTVAGVRDQQGRELGRATVAFSTVRHATNTDAPDPEEWTPEAASAERGWKANRPASPWETLDPLMAPPGVTAVSGRVLTLDGRPLRGVTLEVDGRKTEADRTGRFLLMLPVGTSGRHVLDILGETASHPGRKYGFFEYGLTVVARQTNVLPFTIWMPKLDERHVVRIPSPTRREVVITTPSIPGLEVHIPPDTVIRGEDGKPVTELGITAIPVDRPPFPLAKNVEVPVYFTVQPGGGYIYTGGAGPKGAWLVYPNYQQRGVPGQRVQFFHYDPDERDWYVYGLGTVTRNGAQVTPDATTRIYEFTGAMLSPGYTPAADGGVPGGPGRQDPVDPATGVFLLHTTDLYLPDVIPLSLTRTYNSGDSYARAFGRGMVNPYGMFLWSANQYQEADLILPEGGKIHYIRTSSGTGFTDAVFEHTTSPTAFFKSTITWNGTGWDLRRTDGTVYVFGENAPLQAIRDRYGNQVTVSHASGQSGNVTSVTSPNGRWIAFTYDGSNRITQAVDNIGRTVAYTYDGSGNLSTVTDPESGVTTYGYDGSNRLTTIEDGRGITYLTNQYTSGRVTQQTLADPSAVSTFSYTVDGSGNVTQTDVTDPRGHVERMAFNANHYMTSDTEAYGTALARTTTTTRQSGSNLPTVVVDGLGREADYAYDSGGHVLTVTRLAGTAGAVTTTYTYESTFFQVATITDPLGHTWTVGYDADGRATSITDPLSHQTTLAYNAAGQVTSVTDPQSHQWLRGYTDGDLTSTTDPLGNLRTRYVDAAGRAIATTDPLGHVTRTAFDQLNRVTSVTDPLMGQTSFMYDENSNLLTFTDALTHTTTYTYDDSNRVDTRTDPLTHAAAYAYDLNGNLTGVTDRKSQVTSYDYDELDRVTLVTFDDMSTIAYTYDAGDRITEIDDSINGTIARTYDDLDRLTEEVTSEGTVDYTYDDAGRRMTMTVAGQTAVSYAYDNANRLTGITQGTATTTLTYDSAGWRSTLTYPNGIVATYGYDSANRLTSLTYALGMTVLGDLTYTYDAAGHRTGVGGTWARTGIPVAVTSAVYNAGNQLTASDSTSFTYDLNGNLTSDGATTYSWNVRNQLTGLSGGASSTFAYDGSTRRRSKTISGTTTRFLYDGLSLLQELSSGGTPTANLLTGPRIDETITRTDGTGTSSLLVDALGSTLELADGSGNLQTHYTFEPFGATSVSGASNGNAAQYTGREHDIADLYYYRARYYKPSTGRFTSEDPIDLAAGPNLYSYVADNPITLIDSLGLCGAPPDTPCAPAAPFHPDFPPGHVPWNTPYGPDVERAYNGATGGPFDQDLADVSRRFGNNPWSNCVRGCLLSAWDRCKKKYIPDFYTVHTACYLICSGSLLLGGQ